MQNGDSWPHSLEYVDTRQGHLPFFSMKYVADVGDGQQYCGPMLGWNWPGMRSASTCKYKIAIVIQETFSTKLLTDHATVDARAVRPFRWFVIAGS